MTKIVGKVKVILNHAGDSIVNITIDANFGLMNKPIVSTVLDFSDAAARKVKALKEEESNSSLKLRVSVYGGGCSGFQYGFTFEEVINEDDTQVVKDTVTLLIDPMSLQYLNGAEIDYQDNVQGSQFVIKNPNATTTCGCGSSFSA